MKTSVSSFYLISLFFILTFVNFAQDFIGKVIESDEIPATDVQVISNVGETKTDNLGNFKFKEKPKYLFLLKADFQPLFIKNEIEINKLQFHLEKDSKFNLRECKPSQDKSYGEFIKLTIPKEAKITRSSDSHYVAFQILLNRNGSDLRLNQIEGPHTVSLLPFVDQIINTEKVSVSSIYFNGVYLGEDWSGITSNGNYWRKIRVFSESLYYEITDLQAKNFFDKIIDGSCFDSSHNRWIKFTENR